MPPTEPPATRYRRLSVALVLGSAFYAGAVAALHAVALQFVGERDQLGPERVGEVFLSMRIHGASAVVLAVVALVLRRRRACRRSTPQIALLGAVLLLSVSIDRIAGVWVPPPSALDSILEPHPKRGWAHRRGIVGSGGGRAVSINSRGFRGPEVSRHKEPGEFRILFLGDSLTFGYHMTLEETFVARVGDALNGPRATARFQVINGGVGGYSTWQELDLFENEGMRVQPDLVILEYCFNDVAELVYLDPGKISGGGMLFEFSNDSHWSGMVRAIRTTVARRRYLAALDGLQFANNKPLAGPDAGLRRIEDLYRDEPPPAAAAAWDRALSDLTRFHEFSRSRGVPWVLVVFPFRMQLAPDSRIRPQDRLRKWADESGAHLLDLLPAYRQHMLETGAAPAALFYDGTHPNAAGNRIAAGSIVDYVLRHELVP